MAIDGKTSPRSHDRKQGAAPLHLVSAFSTSPRSRRCSRGSAPRTDAIATNADVAEAIAAQGAHGLLAVKTNQPSLRAEVEAAFAEAAGRLETAIDLDKGYGRIEERRMAVLREIDWGTATVASRASCA